MAVSKTAAPHGTAKAAPASSPVGDEAHTRIADTPNRYPALIPGAAGAGIPVALAPARTRVAAQGSARTYPRHPAGRIQPAIVRPVRRRLGSVARGGPRADVPVARLAPAAGPPNPRKRVVAPPRARPIPRAGKTPPGARPAARNRPTGKTFPVRPVVRPRTAHRPDADNPSRLASQPCVQATDVVAKEEETAVAVEPAGADTPRKLATVALSKMLRRTRSKPVIRATGTVKTDSRRTKSTPLH